MIYSRSYSFAALALVAAAGSAAFAIGDISTVNSVKVEERVFNDFPNSSLTTTNNFPTLLNFNESIQQDEPGGFANKHVGWLSNDGGTTRFQNNYWQSWTLNFTVQVDAPNGFPRKEAGIEVRNPRPRLGYTDEGQVLIASDGEVAVFGGVMPFIGLGNVYTRGTTANVEFRYFAPGVVDPIKGAIQLIFTDAVTGVHDSGLKIWGNESDGLFGFNDGAEFGLKSQNAMNNFIADNVNVAYGNVGIVPSPAGLGVLALGGLMASRRRRA